MHQYVNMSYVGQVKKEFRVGKEFANRKRLIKNLMFDEIV